jgi:hypothetical protein
MAKKNLVSVKMDPEVYRLCKTAAAWKGQEISEYLSENMRRIATRDCARIGKAAAEAKEEAE